MTQKIAIIGSGISGLTSAYLLNEVADITVFEANDYIGGHTATKTVEIESNSYDIDTGFIVFNDWTYPNFIKLMDKLGVKSQATQMSFSVKNVTTGLEYNGHTLNTLFSQRRNIFSPKFWRLVLDIVKFNKLCKAHIKQNKNTDNITLIEFIRQHKLSEHFTNNYILPMCAAIWSTSLHDSAQFPLSFFLKFFNNHGLLNIKNRPQWHTILGGSKQYIEPLVKQFKDKIRLNSPVSKVQKTAGGFDVHCGSEILSFDQLVFACHSDQALKILDLSTFTDSFSSKLSDILGAIPYSKNDVVLHTDENMLPKSKLAWASWNYQINGDSKEQKSAAKVTYNMNILQKLECDPTFCVSLNNTPQIASSSVLGQYTYHHPQFSPNMVKAQQRRSEICGVEGLHFCGAYWFNGFHEDGVRSALDVTQRFGVTL